MFQLYSFDSGYSLVVLEEGGRQYKRGSDITIFFPKHSFLSLLISCLYLSLNSCFVFVLLLLLILYLLILDLLIFDLKSVNDI